MFYNSGKGLLCKVWLSQCHPLRCLDAYSPMQASERLPCCWECSDLLVRYGVECHVTLPECVFNDTFRLHVPGTVLSILYSFSFPAPDSLPYFSPHPPAFRERQLGVRKGACPGQTVVISGLCLRGRERPH